MYHQTDDVMTSHQLIQKRMWQRHWKFCTISNHNLLLTNWYMYDI